MLEEENGPVAAAQEAEHAPEPEKSKTEEIREELSEDKIRQFVEQSTDGFLNHYAPTFKNIQKDLERLNSKQEVLTVQASIQNEKFKKAEHEINLPEIISITAHYKDRLDNLKVSMLSLTERSSRLRERAAKLQERKQLQALSRESKRAANQEREQHLIAKNDTVQ